MPLLYRKVVPNAPAWTAGNGSIVFGSDGKPSHRAEMKIVSVTWSGTIDTSDIDLPAPVDGEAFHWMKEPADVVAPSVLNGMLARRTSSQFDSTPPYAHFHYNALAPANDAEIYDGRHSPRRLNLQWICKSDAQISGYDNLGGVSLSFHVGLLWDASLSSWEWTVHHFQFAYHVLARRNSHYFPGETLDDRASVSYDEGDATSFSAGTSNTQLRVGAGGVTMAYCGENAAFSGTAITVCAAYA